MELKVFLYAPLSSVACVNQLTELFGLPPTSTGAAFRGQVIA
jgi:hypothetical protein